MGWIEFLNNSLSIENKLPMKNNIEIDISNKKFLNYKVLERTTK